MVMSGVQQIGRIPHCIVMSLKAFISWVGVVMLMRRWMALRLSTLPC